MTLIFVPGAQRSRRGGVVQRRREPPLDRLGQGQGGHRRSVRGRIEQIGQRCRQAAIHVFGDRFDVRTGGLRDT